MITRSGRYLISNNIEITRLEKEDGLSRQDWEFHIAPWYQANPALIDASLAVNCSVSGRYLTELYICFSKDGQPAACGADVRKSALKSCANPDFIVRSVR